jgi:alpha-beta hydrolase superfamily lysophospholipase
MFPGVVPSAGFNKRWDKEPNSTGKEWLSRDREVGIKFNADPLIFPETAIQVFGFLEVTKLLGTPTKKLPNHLSVLLIAGSEDPLGGERGNKLLLNAFRRAGVEVIADVVEWLNTSLKN